MNRRLKCLPYDKYLALLLAIFVLLLAPPLQAQDTPADLPTETPSATATFTETPSQTPTATETASATPSETATSTVVPTETPTTIATETATATLAETPSLTPSATASFTPEGLTLTLTPSLTPSATATPLPPEPGLNLGWSETFSGGGNPFEFLIGADRRLVPGQNTLALQIEHIGQETQLIRHIFDDGVVELRFLLTTGLIRLHARIGPTGRYTAVAHGDGLVELYRNDLLIASAATTALSSQWHSLRLSLIGGTIRVTLDGVEIISFQDNSPLPAGLAGFEGDASGLLVDDLQVWMPETAVRAASFAGSQLMSAPFTGNDAIYYSGRRTGSPAIAQGVFVLNDTGITFPVLPVEYTTTRAPDWSPVTQKLAFECNVSVGGGVSYYDICISNLDGSGATDLTLSANNTDFGPTFSPTGEWVAFISIREGVSEVWARNISSGIFVPILLPSELPPNLQPNGFLDWANNDYIYVGATPVVGSTPAPPYGIYRVSFEEALLGIRVPEQVTDAAGVALAGLVAGHHTNPDVDALGRVLFTAFYVESCGITFCQRNPIIYFDPTASIPAEQYVLVQLGDFNQQHFAEWSPQTTADEVAYVGFTGVSGQYGIYVIDAANPTPQRLPIDPPYLIPDLWPLSWELESQATQTPLPATQTAQAILTLTAQASTPTPTPTPFQNCSVPVVPVSGEHFLISGGLLRHQDVSIVGFPFVPPGHTLSLHVTQPDAALKSRLGTFNPVTLTTITRASAFFDPLRADGLVAETLTQNHQFIVVWSATASQGGQLDGLFAQGQGIVASGFSPILLDFFGNTGRGWKFENNDPTRSIVQFFPESVRVILRCNFQDPRGIPYTIITSFPDE